MPDTCINAIECCPTDPFNLVATTSPPSDQECLGQQCCDPPVFSLIPDSGGPIVFVTCNALNEFSVWLDGAPVLCSSGDEDLGLWLDGAPFVEKSDTY